MHAQNNRTGGFFVLDLLPGLRGLTDMLSAVLCNDLIVFLFFARPLEVPTGPTSL